MTVQITKLHQATEPAAPPGDWDDWVQGRENSGSLPIDYEMLVEFLGPVRLGDPLVAWRKCRNGTFKEGLYISTPVTEVVISTVNSVYRVTTPATPSVIVRDIDPAAIIENVRIILGVSTSEVARWIFRFGSTVTNRDILGSALMHLAVIARFAMCFGSDANFQAWLRTRSLLLSGNSPLDWLAGGRLEEVAEFLSDAASGQPT